MAKKKFYAVAKGRKPGIFLSWDECKQQVNGFPGQDYLSFKTLEEARAWLAEKGVETEKNPSTCEASELPNNTDDLPPWDMVESASANIETSPPAPPAHECTIELHPDQTSPIQPETDAYCKRYGFDALSTDQRRAVQSVDGKVLLFAVPGSGKTTVLIARTGYMIHSRGIAPGQIVSLTFTKASAAEMELRYQKRFPQDTNLPQFRTIHSFAFSVILPRLRNVGFGIPHHLISDMKEIKQDDGNTKKQSFNAIIFSELNDALREIAKENDEKHPALLCGRKDREALETAITGIKNTRMTRAQLRGKTIHLSSNKDLPIDRAYDIYINLCKKHHCMDFDDMLIYALEGLQKHPEVLHQLQKQYRYWSIDESQDNSPLQHDLLQLLVGENGNLFMVGDDDQSIYAFRGAKPRRFQEFGMAPDVKVLTMGTNYRSACGIVRTAESFIKENASHQDKQMNAAHSEPGSIRFIYDLHREKHQYEKIVETAKACRANGQELAVLYRENISALPVMFYLEEHKIPFFTAAKLSEVLQSPYISRIMNLLRFTNEQNSYRLFEKAKDFLNVYPSKDALSQLKKSCKAAPKRNVLELLNEIDEHDHSSKIEALAEAATAEPYTAIQKLMDALDINPNSQSERMQVNAILSVSALYKTISEMLSAIDAMKRKLNDTAEDEDDGETAPPESECEQLKANGNAVTLTTMHSAKGLEFDHVMIIDYLAPPIIPFDPMQLTFDDPEEPRRLFYVAMTRAKQTLDILTVQFYHSTKEEPHPFIREYALLCDRDNMPAEYAVSAPDVKDCRLIKAYGKYYGVPVGRKPGVYTSWAEAKAQTEHYSIGQNEQPKGFHTYEKAAEYAYPNGIPEQVRPLDTSFLRQYLVSNPTLHSNWPQDIHPSITSGILKLLKTDSILSLSPSVIESLKMDYLSAHSDACDYSGNRAIAYTVNYLPLNYYKIWTPLWKLLEKQQLPYRASVLELGAGPGTSGLSLLDFYGKLAAANPDIQFAVKYTAVERESDFIQISNLLWDELTVTMPRNLRVCRTVIKDDAFDFMNKIDTPSFDIVLESNMLNQNEALSEETLRKFRKGLVCGLHAHGHAILIEPGKYEQKSVLTKAVHDNTLLCITEPEISAIDITAISLLQQCFQVGLRYSRKLLHWYSMIIAERKPL